MSETIKINSILMIMSHSNTFLVLLRKEKDILIEKIVKQNKEIVD